MTWGFAPSIVTGIVAGFVPPVADKAAVASAALMVLAAAPVATYAFLVRRSNQARYESAVELARAAGQRVRVIETEGGDHEYLLYDPPAIKPLDAAPAAQG